MIRPKKSFGQHFLKDETIVQQIADGLLLLKSKPLVLEVGPGMGVLTEKLLEKDIQLTVIELDRRLPNLLREKFPQLIGKIIEKDILKFDFKEWTADEFYLIGNYPYNISSQILFKLLDNRQQIPQMLGMFQKEVAQRITAIAGNKAYGILSVLSQAFYETEYLFDVAPTAFNPPPKVMSGVIRLQRKSLEETAQINYKLLARIVKKAFNQRRKKLSNALKEFPWSSQMSEEIKNQRADKLTLEDYLELLQLAEDFAAKQ